MCGSSSSSGGRGNFLISVYKEAEKAWISCSIAESIKKMFQNDVLATSEGRSGTGPCICFISACKNVDVCWFPNEHSSENVFSIQHGDSPAQTISNNSQSWCTGLERSIKCHENKNLKAVQDCLWVYCVCQSGVTPWGVNEVLRGTSSCIIASILCCSVSRTHFHPGQGAKKVGKKYQEDVFFQSLTV